jgi:hypothetical protein
MKNKYQKKRLVKAQTFFKSFLGLSQPHHTLSLWGVKNPNHANDRGDGN